MSTPVRDATGTSTSEVADVIVLGGGLTGLALACALGTGQARVTLIEQKGLDDLVEPAADGRVTAIARGTRTMLDKIKVWPHLELEAQPIFDIMVGEGSPSFSVHYDHRDVGGAPLGWIVPNRALRLALMARLRELPNVTILAPARCVGLQRTSTMATAHLADGRFIRGSLVAVCEGKRSATRSEVGIKARTWDYRQNGLVCTFTHDQPHQGIAFERFFPDGPLATLPMTDDAEGRPRTSIVWALANATAARVADLDDAAFAAEVMTRIGSRLGTLVVASRRWTYPLSLVWADRYTDERLALVGDCARGIHPLAGQGWNLGARDVAALAEIVTAQLRLGLDPGEPPALDRYAAWRGFDSVALVGVTDGLNRLFNNDFLPVKLARNMGLGAVQRTPPVKRFFMRHAMGLTGDLPALMREDGRR